MYTDFMHLIGRHHYVRGRPRVRHHAHGQSCRARPIIYQIWRRRFGDNFEEHEQPPFAGKIEPKFDLSFRRGGEARGGRHPAHSTAEQVEAFEQLFWARWCAITMSRVASPSVAGGSGPAWKQYPSRRRRRDLNVSRQFDFHVSFGPQQQHVAIRRSKICG
jgi:hypothetical protein